MKLALVSLPVVICISVAILESTSGQQFCWFQKKTRTGEDREGKRRRFTPGMVRYVGANVDAWACTRHWARIMQQSIPAAPIPPPPGQLRGICTHRQSRGSGISLPKGSPQAFDTHVVSDSKSKRRRFYRKRPVVCH